MDERSLLPFHKRLHLPHWLYVLWLRALYFPFWRTVSIFRRAIVANRANINLVTTDELWRITAPLDEHPDDWEHACMCATCRSYGDG